MPVVRELITKLGYKIDDGDLKKYDSQLGNLAGSLAKIGAAAVAAAGALAVIGAKSFITNLVQTNIEFEKLKASLNTVTGSADKGAAAFKQIQDFASTTPFSLQEVSSAFIKLKSLGIDPTEDRLRSFGNTAAAMGKPLEQFIEAVADASTGEFERLKEFGIKSSKQGDQVKFTFQGVTTTVKNSSEAINGYLQGIGDNQFAGSMSTQMNTLGGIISNIKDNFSKFLLTVGEAGFNDALRGLLTTVRDLGGENDNLAVTIGQNLGKAVVFLSDALALAISHLDDVKAFGEAFRIFATVTSPIGLIALAIDELFTLMRGGDTLFAAVFGDEIAGQMRAFALTVRNEIMLNLKTVIRIFGNLFDVAMQVFETLKPQLSETFEAFKQLVAVLIPASSNGDTFGRTLELMVPLLEFAVLALGFVVTNFLKLATVMLQIATVVFPVFSSAFGVAFEAVSFWINLVTGDFEAAKNNWIEWLTEVSNLAQSLGFDISGITDGLKSLAGFGGIDAPAVVATSAAAATGNPAAAGSTNNTSTNSVGAVVVNVAGTTNMGPDEMASATQAGTTRGLRDALSDANRNTQGALT